jgi:hypothetical protein
MARDEARQWLGIPADAHVYLQFGMIRGYKGLGTLLDAWQEVQVYLAAADCMVLTHARGLNSGVAVLGMTFGNLVVGPRLGCMEWVLGQGCNRLYAPSDMEALVAAMEEAPRQDAVATASTNKSVAAGWRWEAMARTILDHPAMGLCQP